MTKISVKKPFTVLVAVVLAIVLGVVSFMKLKTDLLPKMDLPYVIVMTTAPGASPERVEMTVTQPLEQALATTSGLENMQSMSMENASVIIMEFSQNINMDSAMIEMTSSIDMVEGYLEDTVSSPMIMKINPDMLPIQVVAVDMDGMDIKELSSFVSNEISPYLERINGVATVQADGLVEDYVDIALNQEKIDAINEKILESVDATLAKTQRELNSAQAKITEGKAELAKQRDEAFKKLADGAAELDAGQAQLQAIVSEKNKLEAEKALLSGALQAVEGLSQLKQAQMMFVLFEQYGITDADTLNDAVAKLLVAQKQQTDENGNPVLDENGDPVMVPDETAIQLAGALSEIIATGMFDGSATVGDVKKEVAAQIAVIEETLRSMGINEIVIATGSADILKAEISLVESDIKQAEFLAKQMESTVNQLKTTYAELEQAKMAAVSAMAVGEVQLQNAQSQLDSGIAQFESARDEALRSANINALVSQSTISGILMAQNFSMPAGYIQMGEERVTVKVGEKFDDVESLENLLLVDMGMDDIGPIYLKDVADVSIKDNAADSFVRINGNAGVTLTFQKSSVASTSEVSDAISEAVKELEAKHEGLHIATLMDQGDYINMVVDSVLGNLVSGGLIALLVLIVFLKSVRPTAVIGMSIPLSLLVAVVLMYFTDITLNVISLAGLALAVGMLVDNSIVVIENIYRLRGMGYDIIKASVLGTKQVGGAIAASTLTTVCVFLPIVFTQGLTRQIFTDMGLTIAYALIASLVVALTFVPCMSSVILKNDEEKPAKIFDKIVAAYQKLLRTNLRHKWAVIILSVGLLGLSVWGALNMPMTFIPAMDGNQMTMTFTQPATISDEDLYAKGFEIAQKAQAVPEVDTVAVMSQSEGGTLSLTGGGGSVDAKSLSFYVVLEEGRKMSNAEIAALIEEKFPDYKANGELSVTTEIMDMSALTGGSGISVSVKGNDFDTLNEISSDLADLLMSVEGVAKADDGSGERSKELRIEIDKAEAMKHGMTTAQVYQLVAAALTEETQATTFTFDNKDLKGYITATAQYTSENITDLEIVKEYDEDGKETVITLGDIAKVSTAESPDTINRDNQSRTYTVSARFEEGVNTTLVSREAEALLEQYEMPEGYQLVIGGENQMVMEALFDMMLMILLACLFIYLIMVAQFQSLLSPFIVLFTIPLAFTGGLLALMITGTKLSIVSMIGFLVLAGVVVNNGIVFIDYVNQLRAEGMDRTEALVKAGGDRIRPILMTALTTILAMSTMAFGVGMGAEMSQGMAIVSIGGLAYATLLTLFLVPALYDMMHKKPLRVINVDFDED